MWDEGINLGLFRRVIPYPGAIKASQQLAELGELSIITSRPKRVISDSYAWLGRYEVPACSVHILDGVRKSSVQPHANLYIDDSPDVLADLLENTDAHVVCFSRPWNADVPSHPRLFRTGVWNEVIAHVRGVRDGEHRAA